MESHTNRHKNGIMAKNIRLTQLPVVKSVQSQYIRMNRTYSISDTDKRHDHYKIKRWHNRY